MKSVTSHPEVIVIGAGIAGLTAAYVLKQQGISVKVIEAARRVGGRMTSDVCRGHTIDRGAQFLSTEYSVILDLLQQLELSPYIRQTSQCSSVIRDGLPRKIRTERPTDALTSGLLRLPAWIRLGWNGFRLGSRLLKLPLSNYSRWAAFDSETTAAWVNRDIGREVTEYVYEPMLQGFYFQTPEEASKALALVLTAFGARRAKTISLEGGLGALPTTLAERLDVELDMPAKLIKISNGKVRIETPSGQLHADRVILAVPAPIGLRVLQEPPDELAGSLLATPYSANINVAVITDTNFSLPDDLQGTYGILIPRKERLEVAAVGIENNKNRDEKPVGHLLNLMFCHESATRLMSLPDEVVVTRAVQSLEGHFPLLSQHIAHYHVYRWPMAEPHSQLGRATELQRYRQQCPKLTPLIVLAGDYMSMPYTEGAAESGKWAAELVARAASNKSRNG